MIVRRSRLVNKSPDRLRTWLAASPILTIGEFARLSTNSMVFFTIYSPSDSP